MLVVERMARNELKTFPLRDVTDNSTVKLTTQTSPSIVQATNDWDLPCSPQTSTNRCMEMGFCSANVSFTMWRSCFGLRISQDHTSLYPYCRDRTVENISSAALPPKTRKKGPFGTWPWDAFKESPRKCLHRGQTANILGLRGPIWANGTCCDCWSRANHC